MKLIKKIPLWVLLVVLAISIAACIPELPDEDNGRVSDETIIEESTGDVTEDKITSDGTAETTKSPETTKTPETTKSPETTAAHEHKFSEASCTKPQICSCGETKGEAWGHNWTNATCTAAKTCNTCGATEGYVSGHIYSNGSCTVCGANDPDYVAEELVWIPTKGGTKYHTRSNCSNMDDPDQVTEEEAIRLGFEPCKRCH